MKLSLVVVIVGFYFTTVTRSELSSLTALKCSSKNIDMRLKVVDLYTGLNQKCGVGTPITVPTTTTTTTTTTPFCDVKPDLVTLTELYNEDKKDHFYVTSAFETSKAQADDYQELRPSPGRVTLDPTCPCGTALTAIYRLVNRSNNDHFYTGLQAEADNAVTRYGYKNEGIKFHCSSTKGVCGATVPLYRFYDGTDHIYSTVPVPATDTAKFEGSLCYIWPS